MTVIAGYRDKKNLWIGGDSGAFDGDSVMLISEPKVWRAEDSLIGFAGGFRLAEIAEESNLGDPYALRDHILTAYKSTDEAISDNDTGFLVVHKDGIFVITSDFAVVKSRENYGAEGAGALSAMSALFALEGVTMTGKERITTALKATAHLTTSARAPFKILSI